jgi:hypothetical protein
MLMGVNTQLRTENAESLPLALAGFYTAKIMAV